MLKRIRGKELNTLMLSNKLDINGAIVNYYQNDIKLLSTEIKANKDVKYYIFCSNQENKKMMNETLSYNGINIDNDIIIKSNTQRYRSGHNEAVLKTV